MRRALAALALCAALAACGPPRPTAGVTVRPDGDVTGAVGVESGRVAVGVDSDGEVGGSVAVVNRPNAQVRVGTGGASASVRPGGGPLRVGLGRGGLRLGL